MHLLMKSQLFDMIMSGKDIQSVMDICEQLIGNPFALANRSLQLIAKSRSCDQFPEFFDWIENRNGEAIRYGSEAYAAGYFKQIYGSDQPVYGRLLDFPVNWVAARVRFRSQVIGSILVADCREPFSETYGDKLPLVCQAIAFVLQQSAKYNQNMLRCGPLLTQILEGTVGETDGAALREHFRLLQNPLPKTMRLLALRSGEGQQNRDIHFMDAVLFSQFPSSIGVDYRNDSVHILDGAMAVGEIEAILAQHMDPKRVVCGISRVMENPAFLRDGYLQADAAIRLKAPGDAVVSVFDNIVGPYVLEQVAGKQGMRPEGILMPEISRLLSEEKDTGEEKLRDLAAFLHCGRNVTRAAALRNIHKNSLYYRLDRIGELTGLDLWEDDTCIRLTLSLILLGYLPYKNK